jgi:hypothetical protein
MGIISTGFKVTGLLKLCFLRLLIWSFICEIWDDLESLEVNAKQALWSWMMHLQCYSLEGVDRKLVAIKSAFSFFCPAVRSFMLHLKSVTEPHS